MRLVRFIGYFSRLSALFGFTGASRFAAKHMWNKTFPAKHGRLMSVPVGRYRFYFPSLDYFSGLFAEIFLQETYYLPKTNAPLAVIDAGANIGMSLLYIKLQAPNAGVICFEPNPAARAVLEENIAINHWADIEVLPYALGKEKGIAQFSVDPREATSSGGRIAGKDTGSYPVDVAVLSPHIGKKLDFLKMDIEGGEFAVLEELVSSGALGRIREIQLEYHFMPSVQERPLSDLLAMLEQNDFHTFAKPTCEPHSVVGMDRQHAYMVFAWR